MKSAALDQEGWTRAWNHGYAAGVESGAGAAEIAYLGVAKQLLDLCRVSDRDRRAIWLAALAEVDLEYGDLERSTRRALAARRIAVLLERRIRRDATRRDRAA